MYKAIVIDDEHMIVKGLSTLVNWNKLGYRLAGTSMDCESALTLISTQNPEVVVSDIQLADGTGLDIFKNVRRSHPDTLFVFISGYDEFKFCQKALALGAVDYLLKPVDFKALEDVLNRCRGLIEDRKILKKSDRIRLIKTDRQNTGESADKLIHRIKNHIDENYFDYIDSSTLSDRFHISQAWLSELFKKEFGTGFKKYLTGIRMEKAKLYIMENKLIISEIASRVGFDDAAYFSRSFRKYTGMTPREYRKEHVSSP